MISDILSSIVMKGLKKSIRKKAKVDAKGIYGSVGLAICAVPIVVSILFGFLAFAAINDPDPGDKKAGYIVIIFIVALLFLILHYLSYSIVITNHSIYSRSLFLGERFIRLNEPFTLEYVEESQQLILSQKYSKIKIKWFINGFDDFRQLISEAHQKQLKSPIDDN